MELYTPTPRPKMVWYTPIPLMKQFVVEYFSDIVPMPPFLILHLLIFNQGKLLTVRKKDHSSFTFRLPSYELPSDSGSFNTIEDYIHKVRDEWLHLSPNAFTLAPEPLQEGVHEYPLETGTKKLPTLFIRIDTAPVDFKLPAASNLRGFEPDTYRFHWADRNDMMDAMGGIGETAGVVAMEEFSKPLSLEAINAHQAWLRERRDGYQKQREEAMLAPENVRNFLANLPQPPIPGLGLPQPVQQQDRKDGSMLARCKSLTLEEKNRAVQGWLPSILTPEEGLSDESEREDTPDSSDKGGKDTTVDSSPARPGFAGTRGKPKFRKPADGELDLIYQRPIISTPRGRGRGRDREFGSIPGGPKRSPRCGRGQSRGRDRGRGRVIWEL